MALFIGIDPGVHTGIAIWDSESKGFMSVTCTGIVLALDLVRNLAKDRATGAPQITLVVEDARRRKWIPQEKSFTEAKGRAMGAGSVMRDCAIWEECAKLWDIPLQLVPPQKGATKWPADTFARVTGWQLRTNDHARDAAMLVFGKC